MHMAAASMLRGVAAGALRRRSSLLPAANGAPLLPLPRALHNSAAAPPPAVTAAQRQLSTAEDAISEWERKAAEKAKGEILRHLLLKEAADSSKTGWDKERSTEQLEDYLRRHIKIDAAGAPVLAGDGEMDKHLLLALLVRWMRAEEKLSSNAAKLKRFEEVMGPTRILANFMAKIVFLCLPVSAGVLYGISYVRSIFAS